MASGPTISQQKIFAAARNNRDLLEVLTQVATSTRQQQATTGTTPSAQTSSVVSAAVPQQANGVVSILGGAYVVQITNPGATNPLSALQAAQAAGNAGFIAPVQPVKAIFHQIRVSTSPAFNVNSNTQTFGGNTGSAQVYWTLTGLGSGTWYVQFRSTYDGKNFNQWKNANSGNALGGLVNQVTIEAATNSEWALFNMPGGMIAGFGEGDVPDQGIFGLAQQVYSSGMIAIAGPNGFPGQNNGVCGMSLADVTLQKGTGAVASPADYPVLIRMQMATADNFNLVPANAAVFAFAFDPSNPNVQLYEQPGGSAVWAVMKLSGGARIAWGQGKNLDGTSIYVPPELPWVVPARMMSLCSMTDAPSDRPPITGYGVCQLSGLAVEAQYLNDAGGMTGAGIENANWMVLAWQPGTDVTMVGGFPFLKINLSGGHAVYVGMGQSTSGVPIALPAGCTAANSLSICIPGGSDNSGGHMRGIQQCGFSGLTPLLAYTDNLSTWSGLVNWAMAAWI
jgi:hypothetical protein